MGVYPMPYSQVGGSVFSLPAFLFVLVSGISPETRNQKGFRRRIKFTIGSVTGLFLVGYTLIFYNFFYSNASGGLQSIVALGLPTFKVFARFVQEYLTSKSPNPDFAHSR